MNIYDEILNANPPSNDGSGAAKGTMQWQEESIIEQPYQAKGTATQTAGQPSDNSVKTTSNAEQNDGKVKSVTGLKDVKPINTQVTTKLTTDPLANAGKGISLLDLYKRLNPRPNIDEKEEEKKQRRAQLAAAIGDGVSALSNLFFTYQGAPNSYTGENNITAQNKVTYDKLKKERDEKYAQYLNGYMRAFQADQANADKERAWKRQLERDKKADEDSDRDYNFRVNKANQDQKNFEAEQKRLTEGKEAEIEAKKEGKKAEIEAKKEIAIANAKSKGIKAVRGNSIVFSDGDNQVQIYGNVWNGSMPSVFDEIIKDMQKAYEADKDNNPRPPYTNSWTEKDMERFVKQNWAKYPSSKAMMEVLSKLDPNNMRAEIEEETPDQYSLGLNLNWGNNDGNDETDW